MDGKAWWATVHGVVVSWTRLGDLTFTFHFHALDKEMATHSTVLAWRLPGTGEPGGLPSMRSRRVGHNWSDLAAAAEAGGRKPLGCEYVSNRNKLMYLSTVTTKWMMNWRGVIIVQERGGHGYEQEWWLQICQRRHLKGGIGRARWLIEDSM